MPAGSRRTSGRALPPAAPEQQRAPSLLGHVAPTPRLCPTTRPPRRHVLGLTPQQGAAGQGQQQAQRRAHPVPICSTWPRWVPRRARAPGPPATTMGSQKPGCRKSNPTALFVPEAAALRPPHGKQRRLRAQRVRCTEVGDKSPQGCADKGTPGCQGRRAAAARRCPPGARCRWAVPPGAGASQEAVALHLSAALL